MMHFKLLLFTIFMIVGCTSTDPTHTISSNTICNPIDLSYRFCLDGSSRREAADPTMVWFKDRYFLFASKSGGYWHSKDLKKWVYVQTNAINIEDYAPSVVVIGDSIYYIASSNEKNPIYKSGNPVNGKWELALEQLEVPVWDPTFFLDDDKRLYLYWGCSNERPLYGVEVDYSNNFSFIGEAVELKYPNPGQNGWEVPGDYNTLISKAPWIEGIWLNKHDGKYYLQYSGPGTEYKSYADGVYVSDHPLGPFKLQEHNPFANKPEGFIAGAGHGSTFKDKYGNYWHIGTGTISQKHIFERRLVLYPAFFDDDGTLYTRSKYGDYPMILPNKKIQSVEDISPGWMLLSYGKNVEVSSSIDSLPASNMVNEDIRTYWAAKTGDAGEYAILDLEETPEIHAIQINFAEHGTALFGRVEDTYHRYTLEYSDDKSNWRLLSDQSKNETDNSHQYIQLNKTISCRYLKISNIKVPDGCFALSGFRVFGKGTGQAPKEVVQFSAERNQEDRRSVILSWNKSEDADGYSIDYGTTKDKLYLNYQVYQDTTLTINSLNADLEYFFTIESFNENGITESNIVVSIE